MKWSCVIIIIIMIITILIIALLLMPLFNGPVSLFGGIYSVKVICFLDLREKIMRQAVGRAADVLSAGAAGNLGVLG